MKTLLSTVIAFVLAQCLMYSQTEIVINEVLYFQDITDTIQDKDHEWLELFNKSDLAINVENWTVSNRDASSLATLPDIEIPSGAYLVIHFKQGTDDLDFSDNLGHYFTQDDHLATDAFSYEMDEIALYEDIPNADNIIDFLAWKASDLDFLEGLAHDYAVAAGIWTSDDFFNAKNASSHPSQKVKRVHIGTSIGRNKDADDTDKTPDWGINGGRNAIEITPGLQNFSNLELIIPPPPPPPPPKEWTFMVYLDGDNDLEEFAWEDINEMEVVKANEDVNVAIMVDWIPEEINIKVSHDNGLTFHPTDSTYRGFLLKDITNKPKKRATLYPVAGDNPSLGEKNMGDPAVLTEFIQWGMTNFPANKYALILWDHGNGWKATTFDDTSSDEFHMGELRDALNPITQLIDLIGFDQCLMAMTEVAYQVYEAADVMVASEESIAGHGWPYDLILTDLKDTSQWNAEQLGKNIVKNFHFFYENKKKDDDHTLSAIALNDKFLELVDHVSDFGLQLTTGIEDYKKHYRMGDNVQLQIRADLLRAEMFGDENYIDLTHFAKLIKNNGAIPIEYKSNAQLIINKMLKGAGVIIANVYGENHKPNAHGLSIYFPEYQTKKVKFEIDNDGDTIWLVDPFDDPTFSFVTDQNSDQVKYAADPDDCIPDPDHHPLDPTPNFLFPQETNWDEFLHRYYEPVADAGADQVVFVGQPVTLIGSGSSDADGTVEEYYWDIDHTINDDIDDYDKDCVDEANDDGDLEGEVVTYTYSEPGLYCVTLTTWDDHHLFHDDSLHIETDQDEVKVLVLPLIDTMRLCREVVSGGAEHIVDGSICIDWTLGEWMTETLTPSEALALCQGFHQGYMTITSIDEKFEDVEIRAFPNPTSALVNIRSGFPSAMQVQLIDFTGKILMTKRIEPLSEIEPIDLSHLPSAIYILRFQDEAGNLLTAFKIQKSL